MAFDTSSGRNPHGKATRLFWQQKMGESLVVSTGETGEGGKSRAKETRGTHKCESDNRS